MSSITPLVVPHNGSKHHHDETRKSFGTNDNVASTATTTTTSNSSNNNNNNNHILLRVKRRRTDPPASCLVLVQPALRRTIDDHSNINNHHCNERFISKRKTRDNEGNVEDLTAACLSSWQLAVNNTRTINADAKFQYPEPLPSSSSNVTTTIWKRREGEIEDDGKRTSYHLLEQQASGHCQIVDAVLEDVGGRTTKRRRLTLLEPSTTTTSTAMTEILSPSTTATTNSKSSSKYSSGHRRRNNNKRTAARSSAAGPLSYPVLDPLSRLVDDSLRAVHVGDVPIWQHWQLLTTDPRLCRPDGMPDTRRWLAWNQTTGGGNLLQSCALWNDVEMLTEILQHASVDDGDDEQDVVSTRPSWLPLMLHAVNGDGWTPYQVAQLAGHASIVQMLETVGGSGSGSSNNIDEDFVYDEYWLCPNTTIGPDEQDNEAESSAFNSTNEANAGTLNDKDMLTVELQGGYWENGELIFAPEEERQDEEELGDHDDEDSNSEGYAGNDYPEDHEQFQNQMDDNNDNEFDDSWYPEAKQDLNGDDEEYYDDSDREEAPSSFRQVPVEYHGIGAEARLSPWASSSYVYDDADDEYDAGYGEHQVVGAQQQRQFAYDPEWDKEEDDEN